MISTPPNTAVRLIPEINKNINLHLNSHKDAQPLACDLEHDLIRSLVRGGYPMPDITAEFEPIWEIKSNIESEIDP